MTTQETFGIATMRQTFQSFQQAGIEWFSRSGVIDSFTVNLRGACAIVERFGTTFDFQRMHAHFGQAFYMGDGAQIFRVHDVSAVLIFKRGHILARTLGLFDHKHFVGWCADTQRRLNILHRNRLVLVYDVANIIFFPFLDVVLPAAGVGAGALVRVALVDIAREQAATGVGHAQRAVNEDLYLHIWHLIADLFNLFQRQLAREDHAGQAHLLPEFHRRPVHGVSLHRKVDRHFREVLTHQHNQPWIGHNQRIRPHFHHRFQVTDKGFQLGVVRCNVDHDIKLFPQRVGFIDAELKIFVVEFVVAHTQGITRLARINSICAISESVTHIFQRSRRGKEFRFKHNSLVLMTGQIRFT